MMKKEKGLVKTDPKIERRQLTVMFCDLVGSTSISEQLDPENFHKLINEYQRISEQVVNQYDGYVAQFLGDGILIYFGYPKAHEDDARRAVKASLELLNNLKSMNNSDTETPLKFRIGIHTGSVVMGGVGGDSNRELLALGDVPNIAALIQKHAKPNQIFVSQNTYQLIKGFYRTRKGKPVIKSGFIYSVLGEKPTEIRFKVHVVEGLTPLIGRDKELRELNNLWNQMKKRSQSATCLIEGEAGIGKSRLVYEFKKSIERQSHIVLECQCWETAKNSPLSPIINLLERILEYEEKDSQEIKIKKIENLLRKNKFKLKETLPLITYILSLSLPKKYKIPLYSPEKLKQESMKAFINILVKFSEVKPVVFIVEDLHWADPSTLDFVSILITVYGNSNILSLFTCRPEFKSEWKDVAQIKLQHLDKSQTKEMVEKLTDIKIGNLAKQVIDKSDGIPLYIEEITKTLAEVSSNNEDKSMESTIPITLNDHLMARLDKLDGAKEVAQVGSVIGREFDYDLLKSILARNSEEIESSVKKLIDDEIIFRKVSGTFIFKHALIQDAAYQSLSKNSRIDLHRKTAESIENNFAFIKENHPDLLAYHYEQAGDINKTIRYLSTAGELAQSKHATRESIAYLEKGLGLLKTLKSSKQKDFLEISLCKHLQYALIIGEVHNTDLVREISERLIMLCEKCKMFDELINPLQSYIHHLYLVNLPRMLYYVKKMNRYANKVNNQRIVMSCLATTGTAYAYFGNYTTSSKILNKAISLYESQKATYGGFRVNDRIMALGESSIVEWNRGYLDISINRFQQALRLSKKSKMPNELPFTLAIGSVIYLKRNQPNIAKKLSEDNLRICEERGLYIYLYMSQILLIHSYVQLNNKKESIYPNLIKVMESSFFPISVNTIFTENLIEIFMFMDMYDNAIELARKTIKTSKSTKAALVSSTTYKLYGDILLLKSKRNKKKAEECYIQSLDIARKQKTRFFELEAVNSYSKLLVNQGRDAEAKKMLSRIVRWFDGRNKTEIKELDEARALLQAIS